VLQKVTSFSRALLMGLAWATVWIPIGMIVGQRTVGEVEPEHIGGPLYAALVCGAIFSAMAGIASGRQRVVDLSWAQALAWAALSGLVAGSLWWVVRGDGSDARMLTLFAIVTFTSVLAGVAASRGYLGSMSGFQAAMLAMAVTGILAGTIPAVVPPEIGPAEQWLTFVVIAGLVVLTVLSASVSVLIARWMNARPL
jgi:hypothetical protein